MGVQFREKSGNSFNISIWAWSYYLGLFEQSGVFPSDVLDKMQSCGGDLAFVSSGLARAFATRLKDMLLSSYKEDEELNNLPCSNSKSATWAHGFMNFLQNDKGYPADEIRVAPGKPNHEILMAFIQFCENTNGFEVG